MRRGGPSTGAEIAAVVIVPVATSAVGIAAVAIVAVVIASVVGARAVFSIGITTSGAVGRHAVKARVAATAKGRWPLRSVAMSLAGTLDAAGRIMAADGSDGA